jgi:cyclic 2,3-diphosphoglycerate synthetase
MDDAEDFDVLLTELKAAAVDVASERAAARGAEVVFVDNRPVVTEGDDDLDRVFGETIEVAVRRAGAR